MTEIRTDDIGFGNLKLLQNPSEFCYGVDAVILADFAAKICGSLPARRRILEPVRGSFPLSSIIRRAVRTAGASDWISTRVLSSWRGEQPSQRACGADQIRLWRYSGVGEVLRRFGGLFVFRVRSRSGVAGDRGWRRLRSGDQQSAVFCKGARYPEWCGGQVPGASRDNG